MFLFEPAGNLYFLLGFIFAHVFFDIMNRVLRMLLDAAISENRFGHDSFLSVFLDVWLIYEGNTFISVFELVQKNNGLIVQLSPKSGYGNYMLELRI